MIKKLTGVGVAIAVIAALGGCATSAQPAGESVALMLPGTTGDGGFLDQSAAGLEQGADEAGWDSQVVESGYDGTKWAPALDDLANSDAKLIITGTFEMIDILEQTAGQYPDKNFVMFDATVDAPNVYSLNYRYDETGFLAGVLAGLLATSSGVDRLESGGSVGVVGGIDIPVIQEYIDGFTKGVNEVAPDVRVQSAFAGSFSDPVKGNAVAQEMISQGAQILFTAAGGSDQGVIQAAADANIWAIGNAQSQADNPQVNGVDAVLTASNTNVQSSIAEAIALAATGDFPGGTVGNYGVSNGAVNIVESDLYMQVVPQAIRDQLSTITAEVGNGDYENLLTGD